MNILITGIAGFIGSKLAETLLEDKINVYGIDNLNSYYSARLKKLRLNRLKKYNNFKFYKIDIKNKFIINKLKNLKKIDVIFHFAAQAGVRYTLSNPEKYFHDNIKSYFNILELAKQKKVKKLFFASSSSVYGDQNTYPLKEKIKLKEKNIYGFSKKINEISSEFYSRIFGFKIIGLRFFTVFGEWGRPDMLIFKYLKMNLDKKKFFLNFNGKHYRDFTYIGDVVKILKKLLKSKFKKNYEIYNVCSNKPKKIIDVIKKINQLNINFKYTNSFSEELKKVEVNKTHGDNKKIIKKIGYIRFTDFNMALKKTIDWYLNNKINKIT